MLGLLAAAGIMSMANTDAMAISRSVDWSRYAGEARDVFVERGGNAETALYAEYDLDNDGRQELIIYDTQYADESDRHVCVFSIDDKYEEMQFVVDAPSPAFCYNLDGKGTYIIAPDDKYIQLQNSKAWIDEKGQYGDGDNLCLQFHGRRSLTYVYRCGNPLSFLVNEKGQPKLPREGEVNVANANLYWYCTKPKVKGQVGVVSFFNAICDAVMMPQLKEAQRLVNGGRKEGTKCIVDVASQYIQVKTTGTESEKPDCIECTMWKRKDGKHVVALNYSISDYEECFGEFSNLLFWEYDAKTSSLWPVDTENRLWSKPNMCYDIDVELPRHGKNIKVTDNETGEQYEIMYQDDEDLVTFWDDSFYSNSKLSYTKGLACSIYDTTGTPTNIRLAPKGKISQYTLEPAKMNLVVGEQKDGYYRIIDNEIEYPESDCDNKLFMDERAGGYWVHRSCLAVKSRHNNGKPLDLLKDWDDCDEQPVVYSIKTPTLLRPIEFAEREGWVKVQTLDGKHTGWVTKDRLSTIRPA